MRTHTLTYTDSHTLSPLKTHSQKDTYMRMHGYNNNDNSDNNNNETLIKREPLVLPELGVLYRKKEARKAQ